MRQRKQSAQNDTPLVFLKFVNDVILQDQTRLVDAMLKSKEGSKYLYEVQNRKVYEAVLSPSNTAITTPILQYFKEMWGKEKSELLRKLSKATDVDDIKSLKEQIRLLDADNKKIDTAKSRERDVFEWLLIPYWLGETLIEYGEVVFRYYGCCWWGVSSILKEHFKCEIILYDVFLDLTIRQGNTEIDNR